VGAPILGRKAEKPEKSYGGLVIRGDKKGKKNGVAPPY